MAIQVLDNEQISFCEDMVRKGATNRTHIAKAMIERFGLQKDPERLRRTVAKIIERMDEDTHRGNAINNYSSEQKTGVSNIKHAWHKVELEDGSKASVFIKNPQAEEDEKRMREEFLDAIRETISEAPSKRKELKKVGQSKMMLKVTISDAHIGLNPNPDGNGLFQYEYNSELYLQGLESVFKSIQGAFCVYGGFDQVVLQDLGDALDGWNGFTTRGGHQLDQNMNNKEAFKTYVRGKVDLIEKILQSGISNKIIIRDVNNDNHSGSFGSIASFAVGEIIRKCYGDSVIEFQPIERFIQHFYYGEHCFIITHGKDAKHMKGGLPLILNDKTAKFINEYIDHYDIRAKYIHVEKGDLHQLGFQKIKKFDYRNYMSFAPGSAWVAHNFGDTYSGYGIDIVPHDSCDIMHTDVFLEYKRK